ncbi:hypothetical protein [Virgibacillus halodenitrificans]|uniref:hypothetical protein n=1 Tax=Virgibacillus halodenitrificans TaxID=1482 RepID=UPI000EF53899|nr:hypothetical protein [Virgibacillus halodenitrificans]
MSKMAIKISLTGAFSNYVGIIRKYTDLGIKEMKNKIESREFLAETDANDVGEMGKLKDLVNSLLKLKAKVEIFDSDRYAEGIFNYQQISYDEFMNSVDRLKEITEELQDCDDALSDEV